MATVTSATQLSFDSLQDLRGTKLISRVFSALYATIGWRAEETLNIADRIQPLAKLILRAHFLVLAAAYDACFGVAAGAAPAPADGAALDAFCSGRANAFRFLTLGRQYGLRFDRDAFVWLCAVLVGFIAASLVGLSAWEVPSRRVLRLQRWLRAILSLSFSVCLVPLVLDTLPYLSCRGDRPAGYPCFWSAPNAAGVAAIITAALGVVLIGLLALARVDLRRASPDASAVHSGTPEALLAPAAVLFVGADQYLALVSPSARAAVQVAAAALLLVLPTLYYLPFHRTDANLLNAAWGGAVLALYAATAGLRDSYGETMGAAPPGTALGALVGAGLLGGLAGAAACAARYWLIARAYAAAVAAGGEAPAFARDVDAIAAARLMEARALASRRRRAGAAEGASDSSRSDEGAGAAAGPGGCSIVFPIGTGPRRGPWHDPTDESVEELYLRAARELATSPRVLVAAGAWALFSENAPLSAQYLRRLRECEGGVSGETRFLAYALDRFRKEEAAHRGEETADMHSALLAARLHERRARIRMRAFWNLLLKDDLELEKLPDAVTLIQASKDAAGMIYERLERRFPNSARVARARAGYLQEFHLELEGAARLLARAQNIEDQQAAAAKHAARQERRRARGRRRSASRARREHGDPITTPPEHEETPPPDEEEGGGKGPRAAPAKEADGEQPAEEGRAAARAGAPAASGEEEGQGQGQGQGSPQPMDPALVRRLKQRRLTLEALQALAVAEPYPSDTPRRTARVEPPAADGPRRGSVVTAFEGPRRGSVATSAALTVHGADASPGLGGIAMARWEPLTAGDGTLLPPAAQPQPQPPAGGGFEGIAAASRRASTILATRSPRASVRLMEFRTLVAPAPRASVPTTAAPSAQGAGESGPPSPQGSRPGSPPDRKSPRPAPCRPRPSSASLSSSPGRDRPRRVACAGPGGGGAGPAGAPSLTLDDGDDSNLSELVARRFYRMQLSNKSGMVAGRVARSLLVTVLLSAVFLAAFYGAARALGKNQNAYLDDIARAAGLAESVARISLAARSVVYAAASTPPYTAEAAARELLGELDDLFAIRGILTAHFAAGDAQAVRAWYDSYVNVSVYDADARAALSAERLHPADALAAFLRRSAEVASAAAATWAPGLLPPGAAAAAAAPTTAAALLKSTAFRFLVDNARALRESSEALQEAVLRDTEAFMARVSTILGATFGGLFGGLVAASVAAFGFAVRAVSNERRAALDLFLELPRGTVKEIRNMIGAGLGVHGSDTGVPLMAGRAAVGEGGAGDGASVASPARALLPRPGLGLALGAGGGAGAADTRSVGKGDNASEGPQSTAMLSGHAAGSIFAEEVLSVDFIEQDFIRTVQSRRRGSTMRRLVTRALLALALGLAFPAAIMIAVRVLFDENSRAMGPASALARLQATFPEMAYWSQERVGLVAAPALALDSSRDVSGALAQDALARFEGAIEKMGTALDGFVNDGCASWDGLLAGGLAAAAPSSSGSDGTAGAASCAAIRQEMIEVASDVRRLAAARDEALSWSYAPLRHLLASASRLSPASARLAALFRSLVDSANAAVGAVVRAMDAVFACGIAAMLLAWFLVLRPAIRGIAVEHETTLSMLLMIPPSVIEKIPAVRDYISTGESRSVQSMLDDNRAKTKSILEAASDAIIVCDIQGSIQVYNRAAERLFGWSADEALAMPLADIVPGLLPARSTPAAPGAGAGAGAGGEGDAPDASASLESQRDDGTTFPAHVSIGRGRSDRRPYFVLFIRDMTLQNAAEAALQAEKTRSERLLRNILPDPIIERLKAGSEEVIADAVDEATILFSDLVGFTSMSSEITAEETVSLLSDLFNRFDELLDSYGVDKVKTIGDAYMAYTTMHPEVMIDFAFDMQEAVRSMNRERGTGLSVRIGVHTGPIVAGVIGTKRLAYDIWGDTVNIASRMESNGVAGRVNISSGTFERVRHKFTMSESREVEVKGKGLMTTYLVEARKAGGSQGLASASFRLAHRHPASLVRPAGPGPEEA
eukprot:tig00020723_g13506.t1